MTQIDKAVTVNTRTNKTLLKTVADLTKTVAEMANIAALNVDITEEIEDKQAAMALLEAEYSDNLRKAKAELQLCILENKEVVLAELMEDRGLAEITVEGLADLVSKFELAVKDNSDTIKAEVAKAVSNTNRTHEMEMGAVTAEQSVETATLKAKIESLGSKVQYLEENNQNLQGMLDAERQARVDVSKNSQQPVFNMPNGK